MSKINVGRGFIERLASQTAIPDETAPKTKTYESQYYPAPSPEAVERARKNSVRRRRPKSEATKVGVQLLEKLGLESKSEILSAACPLDPEYREISRLLAGGNVTAKMRLQLQEQQGKAMTAFGEPFSQHVAAKKNSDKLPVNLSPP